MITQDRLKRLLRYNRATGVFVWIDRPSNRVHIGDVAGHVSNSDGYVWIRLDGRLYVAHVLAWLYVMGDYPTNEIDHRDLNRANNAWSNLRPATREQQMHNLPRKSNNKSGYKGVDLHKASGLYRARIRKDGVVYWLGCFKTAELAHAAYCEASTKLHGAYGRT